MKFIFIILSLLILLDLPQCKKSNKKKYQFFKTDFKSSRKLTGAIVKISNVQKAVEISTIPKQNLLLIIDLEGVDFVKVYSLNNLKFRKAFIRKGVKLNEQLDCHKLQYDSAKNLLYAVDRVKKKIFVYNLNDVLSSNEIPLPTDSIQLNAKIISRPLILNNQEIVDTRLNLTGKPINIFNFFDLKGSYLYANGKYPVSDETYPPEELNYVFASGFSLSDDKKYIVAGYMNTDFIDVFDTRGNLKYRRQGPDIVDAKIVSSSYLGGKMLHLSKEGYKTYSIPKMNDKEICVLYSGISGSNRDYHSKFIETFTKTLQPEIFYELSIPIFTFDINWQTHDVYGLSDNVAGKNIIKYRLK